MTNSLISYDTIQNTWSNFIIVGNEAKLDRNSFGAVYDKENDNIFICCGISYDQNKYKVLNVNNLVKIELSDMQAIVTTIVLLETQTPVRSTLSVLQISYHKRSGYLDHHPCGFQVTP